MAVEVLLLVVIVPSLTGYSLGICNPLLWPFFTREIARLITRMENYKMQSNISQISEKQIKNTLIAT